MPRAWDGGAGGGQGLCAPEHLGPDVEDRRRPSARAHASRTVGLGSTTGSKSLKRRIRLPRSVQSMTSSPGGELPVGDVHARPVQLVAGQLLAHVLAGELP